MKKNDNYLKYFTRNIGILTEEEQFKLRESTVGIAGVGGVGGFPAERLARLGVGNIKIADPEIFAASDLNRQFGATVKTIGKKKVKVIGKILKEINPGIKVDVFPDGLNEDNIDNFLDGVDLVIDAIEFFTFEPRMLLYPRARQKNIFVILSGAVGFGSPLLVFSPDGMTMENFFGLTGGNNGSKNFLGIFSKLCPKIPDYLSGERICKTMNRVLPASTLSATCGLAGSLLAEESVFILLKKRKPVVVPDCVMVDLYRRDFIKVNLS